MVREHNNPHGVLWFHPAWSAFVDSFISVDTPIPSPGVKSPEPDNDSPSPQSIDGTFPPDDSPGLESEGESEDEETGDGGDDFDEFEEGDGDDDDFDDFEDGFQHETPPPVAAATPQPITLLPLVRLFYIPVWHCSVLTHHVYSLFRTLMAWILTI